MKRIYKNKTKLRILIDTKCNLSGAVSVTICGIKPDGTLKSFVAGIKDEERGVIFYDVHSAEDFDLSGWWTFWPEVTFDDDTTACGRAVRVFVYESGR
ncbi:MAG: hypothetical protein K6G09_10225 [Treponema sp.]|nr:hypothetical protein [Treponema sp.]